LNFNFNKRVKRNEKILNFFLNFLNGFDDLLLEVTQWILFSIQIQILFKINKFKRLKMFEDL
jgi:hypothetical protein